MIQMKEIPEDVLRKKRQEFHDKHELMTEKIYNTPGMLPDRYNFILTNLCNLKCSFCFQRKDLSEDRLQAGDWIHLAEQLPVHARVTLTGGEPLLFPGFKEVFSFVAERFSCNVITNGTLLTKEIIDFLLSFPNFRVLSVSIDTVKNTIRDIKPDQWQRAEEMMRYFRQKRDQVNPICVLEAKTIMLDENAKDLLEIHKYCMEEIGCDHHGFHFLKGAPIQHADYMFAFEDIYKSEEAYQYKYMDIIWKQLELIRQYNLRTGKISFLHPEIGSLLSEEEFPDIVFMNEKHHNKEYFLPCKFPWSSVHINADGNLFPCMAVSMGNVKEQPLKDIINGEKFAKFRGVIKKEGTIAGCNRCGWIRPKKSHKDTKTQ